VEESLDPRSAGSGATGAQVVIWTILNLALAIVFSLLLFLDDRAARAAGF